MGPELGGTLLLTLLVIALLIFGRKRLEELDVDSLATRLGEELRGNLPVYSAETTAGKEAELIRDRLPKRLPTLIWLAAILAAGALTWWLTR